MSERPYGMIVSVNVSEATGSRKHPTDQARLVADVGIEGDAHAGGDPERQVSLLAMESIEEMVAQGVDVGAGDFAENLTIQGIRLFDLPIGTHFRLSSGAELLLTRIGKECHDRCAIYEQAGDCVMPREGVFARVIRGGAVSAGDRIEVTGAVVAKVSGPVVAVVTCSDSRSQGTATDTAGPALAAACRERGWEVGAQELIADDLDAITRSLVELADVAHVDVIFTCGGTGFGPRDVTPEATTAACERVVPGIPEAIRTGSAAITPRAMLSRGTAGIRGTTLIINLPGSEKAALECLGFVADQIEHAVEMLGGSGH